MLEKLEIASLLLTIENKNWTSKSAPIKYPDSTVYDKTIEKPVVASE